MTPSTSTVSASRVEGLLQLLDRDTGNLGLIAETASAAFESGALALSLGLLGRHEALAPLTSGLLNLKGLALMASGEPGAAAALFEKLLATHPDQPSIAANLAWSRVLEGDHAGAIKVLTPALVADAPGLATLRVQTLHRLGQLDQAVDEGQALATTRPDDPALAAAVALAATDADQPDIARAYAVRAGEHPDALTTLGVLAQADRPQAAEAFYDRALALQPDNARALLGKGLSVLSAGTPAQAVPPLQAAAELFEDHPGSWLAAGWARFLNEDASGARAAFERALAADPNFAESHGALAVLDLAEGQPEQADRRIQIALRLDPLCLSAALAKSQRLDQEGRGALAERIRQIALNAPIDGHGRTLAQALGRRGTG